MKETASLELAEIADSTRPLAERTREMLERLPRLVPFDAAWLALVDPMSSSYTSLASTGLDPGVVEYLSGPRAAQEIEAAGNDRPGPP